MKNIIMWTWLIWAAATGPTDVLLPSTFAEDTAGNGGGRMAATAEQTPDQAAGGKENLRKLRKACEADVKRLCANVRLGGGRILRCLREHESDLSADCKQAMEPVPTKP